MKLGSFARKIQAETGSLENSEYLTTLLVTLFEKGDTPELIAYLADGRNRLLLCKALVSPVSASDRQLEQRAHKILRSRGMDPDELKKRLEPAAFALGLVSSCDVQVDYYDVLGVKPQATSSELRAAYRKRAFELHPDTGRQSSEDETDFITVKAAYDTLNNPNSRAAFDQCRIALDTWHEEDPKEFPDKKPGKRPSGKARKAFYRVAAVVMAMVVIAWVISILYEAGTMVEVVEVASSVKPAREMATSDSGEVVKKASVASEAVKETGFEKPAPKEPVPKESERPKSEPDKLEAKLPEPMTVEQAPLQTAGLAPFKKSSADMKTTEDKTVVAALAPPTPQLEQVASDKPKAVPVAEPEKPKSSPAIESKKKAAAAVKEPLGEAPKELVKPAKKKKVVEVAEVAKKQPPKPPAPVRPKSPEKPAPPVPSVQLATNSPIKVFPDIPIPKTHKTPFVERSQVVDFLKDYTSAYEKGNAQVFFSFFTDNALENGKPLKDIKPDYLKIWGKVQRLDYRISVGETKQVVGSERVSMKGRFQLDWEFFDGQKGQSHGDISMNLEVKDDVLRVSRLDYRFDE